MRDRASAGVGVVAIFAVLAIVAILLSAAAATVRIRERRYPKPAIGDELPYLTSGSTVRRLAVGYSTVAADLYWIRAIQYYGDVKIKLAGSDSAASGSRGGPTDYQALYPLLDLATTLDPRFNIAYRFGAIFLAEPFPGGAGRPDHAIALLEKGLRERPDNWEYMQDIGFVHYWWRRDYQAAADWFEKASRVPGAPWFLRSLAATTLAEGGDRRSSRTMWTSILASAEIEWLRREAERRLRQLTAMDEIDELQKVVDRVAATNATDWATALGGQRVPVDPSGTPYELRNGGVRLSTQSVLYPLPDEPKRLGPRVP